MKYALPLYFIVMDYNSPISYNIGGIHIRISFTNPKVGLICQAYFHLSQSDDYHDYEIIFIELDRNNLASGLNPEDLIPSRAGKETMMQLTLDEGFHLFFLPDQKKVFSYFPDDIFNVGERQSGNYTRCYENTFNDEPLPANSWGVVSTIYWLLECLGIFRLHAAYVEYDNIHIIFPGKGATGKTTTALNVALNGGFLYCDDQVFLKEHDNEKVAIYPSLKKIAITDETINFFPRLLSIKTPDNKRRHKYHFPIESIRTSKLIEPEIPEYIIFPFIMKKTDAVPYAERITSYEGFISFLQNESLYPTVSKENVKPRLNLIKKLANQAKIYCCYNSRDMLQNLQLLRKIILLESISENVVS
ncbi:MAG: hypothetical protein ABFD82_03685 [Syntrophaceae bacterium]